MTQNQIAYMQAKETNRANLAKEEETRRSNLAQEAETHRSNFAKEFETNRANTASEKLKARDLKQQDAANLEKARANRASEKELNRHNVVTEKENQRHNVASEQNQRYSADRSYQASVDKETVKGEYGLKKLASEQDYNQKLQDAKVAETYSKTAQNTYNTLSNIVRDTGLGDIKGVGTALATGAKVADNIVNSGVKILDSIFD